MPCSNTSDVSFGGEQCECRPGSEQSCSSCTKKDSCVWLEDSEIEVTAIVGIGKSAVVSTFELNSGSSCWAGDMFFGPTWTDWMLYGPHLTIHAHLHDAVWSWGQCNITGIWMVLMIFMFVFIALVTLCYCVRLWINRRKFRNEVANTDEPLQFLSEPTTAVAYNQLTGDGGEGRD